MLVLTGVTSTAEMVTISESSISIHGDFMFLVDTKVEAALLSCPIISSIANSGPDSRGSVTVVETAVTYLDLSKLGGT